MDGARRFIEGIVSRQQCLRLTFDVKTKFSLEDVAEPGMNVLGRTEPRRKISRRTVTCQPSKLTGGKSLLYMVFMPAPPRGSKNP